jgi:hypothetical protein
MGFEFSETMSGSYHLDANDHRERAMSFTIRARVFSLVRFLRDHLAEIAGEVDLEGFAEHRAMRGTLEIDPLFGKKLVYAFRFEGDDGRKYRFAGRKTVELTRLLQTMTTLPGDILDEDGRHVGAAKLRFDARSDLRKWLWSFKPA